jgi:hypothetical protein
MLPEFKEPLVGFPTLMVLASQPGVGKSTLIKGLNKKVGKKEYKSLHIDLQGGAQHIGGYVMDVQEYALKEKISLAQALVKIIKFIKEENAKGTYLYDFVTIDPLTSLKPVVEALGTRYYNESVIGKAAAKKAAEEKYGKTATAEQIKQFVSKNVLDDLGQNGWSFLQKAWNNLFADLRSLAGICTIFVAHTKYNTLKKGNMDEIQIKEINFWPSLLLELVGEATDSCVLYRTQDNEVMASFKLVADQQHFKSRYFDGQDIILSKKLKDNTIETYWENIFPFLKA